MDQPSKLKVILSDGVISELKYVGKQDSKPKNTGRLTASNFSNLNGHVFKVLGNKLEPNRTFLLCSDQFLSLRQPLRITAKLEHLDATTIKAIEQVKNVEIEESRGIASIGNDKSVALIKFKPKPNLRLASLVLKHGNGFIFEDYVGNIKNQSSVWRVGDDGEIDPESFKIPYAFQTERTIELVRSWSSFEGENIALLRPNGSSFEKIKEAYRYWAPL